MVDLDIDVSRKSVLDLGCGCGILGLGCVRIGASQVVGIDVDEDALAIARKNRDDAGLTSDDIAFQLGDVRYLQRDDLPAHSFDLVVSNPPFGVWSDSKNIDLVFVQKGLELSDVVYTFHKSATHGFLVEKAREMQGVHLQFILENAAFPIPRIHKFHKYKELSISIDIAKFSRTKPPLV